MSTEAVFEERLSQVEHAVAELQQRLQRRPADPEWLEHMMGCMDDFPEFDDLVRYGKEARDADRPAEGTGA